MLVLAAAWIGAYLIGAIPFGYLVARARGVDIMTQGSGNIGATNVGRVLGMRYGILVFVLDFAKGAIPVVLAIVVRNTVFTDLPGDDLLRKGLVEVGAGLFAFLGHLFPIYLRFRGGKGVATGAGVVAVLMPLPTLTALLVWVLFTASFRFISLASIVAALVLCGAQLGATACDVQNPRNWFCLLAVVLVLARHRGNVVRLSRGTENRLKDSALLHQLAKTLHVLAVGLWFGSAVFFSLVVAPSVFQSFGELTKVKAERRAPWLPLPDQYAKRDGMVDGPREQGRRLAGVVVQGIFPRYFDVQGICMLVALIPAFGWWLGSSRHWTARLRCGVLLVGLASIIAGRSMEGRVHAAQDNANRRVDVYLSAYNPTLGQQAAVQAARDAFRSWHSASMVVNLITLLMATAAMGLAAALPNRAISHDPPPTPA